MRKLFSLIPKRPDIDDATFHTHWREVHGQLALEIVALQRYVQNHALPGTVGALPRAPFDGISTAWFPGSWEDAASAAPPHHADASYVARTRDDEVNFMDVAARVYLAVDEQVLIDRPAEDDPVKVMLFLAPGAGSSPGPSTVPGGLVRQVWNAARPLGDRPPAFAGVLETWWDASWFAERTPAEVTAALAGVVPPSAVPALRALSVQEIPFR